MLGAIIAFTVLTLVGSCIVHAAVSLGFDDLCTITFDESLKQVTCKFAYLKRTYHWYAGEWVELHTGRTADYFTAKRINILRGMRSEQ